MKFAATLILVGSSMLQAQTVPTPAEPISIVVFSDFECPYSADLFFQLEQYRQAHPNELRITVKQSPIISIHPDVALAHRAALAAGHQGKFDAMAELLYANQKHQDLATILADARHLHLDLSKFKNDLNSAAVKAELAADMEESRAFGIDATPTLYIKGKSFVGAQTDASLAAALKSAAPPELDPAAIEATTSANQGASVDPALMAQLEHSPTAEQGSAGAALTIVEFTDFQCPFCKAAAQPLEQFAAAHPRDVRVILRSFPLDFHPDSELANEAALAAGEQGKFWQMHDLLFANQNALKEPALREYAQQLHLDVTAFDDALATHRLAGKISADRALGVKAGVSGTPTFIVDGQEMTGARSVAEWEQLLARHTVPASIQQTVAAAAPPHDADRIITGSATAPLTLTWFTDVRSAQAASQAELVRSLSKRYNGKVRVLFKAYPLAAHPDARLASNALVAASLQHKFWQMYDALTARKSILDRAAVLAIAASLQMDTAAFAADLDVAGDAVQEDMDEAQRRGILGAPVIFLNDRRVDGLQREGFYTSIADDILKPSPSVQGSLIAPSVANER